MKKYPPTPQELRQWMDSKGLSNKDVAKALRLSDGRVVRFWTSKKDPRPIPYPSWYTLRHKYRQRTGQEARSKTPESGTTAEGERLADGANRSTAGEPRQP